LVLVSWYTPAAPAAIELDARGRCAAHLRWEYNFSQSVARPTQVVTIRTILVPVEQHAFIRSVLDAAALVAGRFGSHVEGLALGPDIPDVVAFDIPAGWAVLSEKDQRDLVERSQQLFDSFMLSCGIPRQAEAPDGVSCAWTGRRLFGDSHIGSFGRVFDLIVLGRPGPPDAPPRLASVEAALFESGRAVLLVPPSAPGSIGETVVIAWNGSTETARTVALGMPLLARAQHVTVLSLEGWGVDGPSGEDLAERLQRHGIEAEAATRSLKSRSPGEAILEYAAAFHADLLIKGAYTQSRLRQLIFGGVTSHVLAHAKLPVLMAH
jgi:nucleotide-binding universal stress UspA family protein